MLFRVQQQARTTLYRLPFLELALCVALVITWWASTLSALRLAIELLHVRPSLAKSLRKSKRFVGTVALLFSFCLLCGKKNFLFPPWLVTPLTLSILFVAWTVMAKLMMFCRIKKQKVATGLLFDKLHDQDFAGPLACRASRVLGPISRYRVADIDLHLKLVSRASRPGLLLGFLRILCNGMCPAQRFHTEEHDHTCCVGCPGDMLQYCHREIFFYLT